MQASGLTVYLVEDDQSVRDALGLLLGLRGYAAATFADAESFLRAYQPAWRGCLLVDLRLPGIDGLTLQQRLRDAGATIPIVMITGHGDVGSARAAFRADAVDFLEKPIDHAKLISAIDEAFLRQSEAHGEDRRQAATDVLLSSLTPREKEVMALVVDGLHNREIAELLGISPRTVEVHKERMMTKLRVGNLPDLVRLSLTGALPRRPVGSGRFVDSQR